MLLSIHSAADGRGDRKGPWAPSPHSEWRSTFSFVAYLPAFTIFLQLCLSPPPLLFLKCGLTTHHVPGTVSGIWETAGMHRTSSASRKEKIRHIIIGKKGRVMERHGSLSELVGLPSPYQLHSIPQVLSSGLVTCLFMLVSTDVNKLLEVQFWSKGLSWQIIGAALLPATTPSGGSIHSKFKPKVRSGPSC